MKLKVIPNKKKINPRIWIQEIKPFVNICQVTKESELCNVEIEYIPGSCFIELGSYRKYFEPGFNELIENLCHRAYNDILLALKDPIYLKITVKLMAEPSKNLTPWQVTLTYKKHQ